MTRRTLTIGARRSALARIQALEVGNALFARDPSLSLRYVFSEASGDRSPDPSAANITKRGGFTEDLGLMLDAGQIDLAVHSWKDLPLRERAGSCVVATLPRADSRDLLLIRRDVEMQIAVRGIRILSSSARRRRNLEDFLHWALPVRPSQVQFTPVRGDIETRLGKLLRGDGDALVVAKAAIDRLLSAGEKFERSVEQVRQALEACRVVVLPLSISPAAPAQGALAVEIAHSSTHLREPLAAINHADTWELVQRERAQALQLGDDDSPVGITWQRLGFGDVEYVRGEHAGAAIERLRLHRRGASLPKPASADRIWSDKETPPIFARVPAPRKAPDRFGADAGLLVARADALPLGTAVAASTVLWAAGLVTWRKLAARGYWVAGSDESLGESGALAIRRYFPAIRRWLKLSHADGYRHAGEELLATYRLERHGPLPAVDHFSHFFWRSGSELRAYLTAYPRLTEAWHGCGPGNSFQLASQWLAGDRLRPFLSETQFRDEMLA